MPVVHDATRTLTGQYTSTERLFNSNRMTRVPIFSWALRLKRTENIAMPIRNTVSPPNSIRSNIVVIRPRVLRHRSERPQTLAALAYHAGSCRASRAYFDCGDVSSSIFIIPVKSSSSTSMVSRILAVWRQLPITMSNSIISPYQSRPYEKDFARRILSARSTACMPAAAYVVGKS